MHVDFENKHTDNMKKIVVMAFAMAALSACDSEPKFKVEGEVTGAEGRCFIWKHLHWKGLFLLILSN